MKTLRLLACSLLLCSAASYAVPEQQDIVTSMTQGAQKADISDQIEQMNAQFQDQLQTDGDRPLNLYNFNQKKYLQVHFSQLTGRPDLAKQFLPPIDSVQKLYDGFVSNGADEGLALLLTLMQINDTINNNAEKLKG